MSKNKISIFNKKKAHLEKLLKIDKNFASLLAHEIALMQHDILDVDLKYTELMIQKANLYDKRHTWLKVDNRIKNLEKLILSYDNRIKYLSDGENI